MTKEEFYNDLMELIGKAHESVKQGHMNKYHVVDALDNQAHLITEKWKD